MQHADVLDAIDYLFWLRDRILDAAAELTEDAFRSESTVTTRSLRATLVHQLECEWAWRIRLTEGAFPDDGLVPADFETVEVLVDRWHREESELRRWFGGLTDAELAREPGSEEPQPLATWRHLIYLVNHGTQQFSEAAVLLTRFGQSPGEIGYLEFCLRRAQGQSAPSTP